MCKIGEKKWIKINHKVKRYIDICLIESNIIFNINNYSELQTVACCCGHNKYHKTILVKPKGKRGPIYDLISNISINRKRFYYKKDKEGYYYIPEIEKMEEIEQSLIRWIELMEDFTLRIYRNSIEEDNYDYLIRNSEYKHIKKTIIKAIKFKKLSEIEKWLRKKRDESEDNLRRNVYKNVISKMKRLAKMNIKAESR